MKNLGNLFNGSWLNGENQTMECIYTYTGWIFSYLFSIQKTFEPLPSQSANKVLRFDF